MKLDFEHYGGRPIYDTETKELLFSRECGVGSNVNVLLHFLMDLKTKNIFPEKITTDLHLYHSFDLYKHIFDINLAKLNEWKNFDLEKIHKFLNCNAVNLYGLGTSQSTIDFGILCPVLDVYFNFKEIIINNAEQIINKHNIDTENTVFIWWRETDKPTEITWYRKDAQYPTVKDFLKYIPTGKRVILQTDDKNIVEAVRQSSNHNIEILDILPITESKIGFHHEIRNSSVDFFKQTHNTTIEQHLIDLFSLIYIASKCKHYIGYPGSLTFVIALSRRNFNNFIFFKNSEELY
jgi:hypothetical protein